jgi:predicted membrane-bound dolichyl-phosphate-mannose-protein mannosyltransferase
VQEGTSLEAPDLGVLDRGTRAPTRSFEAVRALVVILVLGLALRLIIAYVLLPGSGFGVDRGTFQAWAGELAARGASGFYTRGFFVDYTPGYLYVLWLVGIVGNAIGGIGDLIKLPPILADVAVAWLVHSMVLELGGSRRAARLGAVLFLINPVTWFDSAIWGQVDAFGVVFLLLALRELWRGRPERASILAVVAAVVKPQLGILVPILAIVLLRRHLVDPFLLRRAAGRAESPLPSEDPASALSSSTEGEQAVMPLAARPSDRIFDRLGSGPIRLVTSGAVAVGAAVALCLPFGLSFVGLIEQVVKAGGGYPYLTVNGYNPWALVERSGSGLAANGTWLRDAPGTKPDEVATLIADIPAVFVGTGLLLVVIAVVCAVVFRRGSRTDAVTAPTETETEQVDADADPADGPSLRAFVDDRRTLLVALVVMAIAFFVVPTRVHERYLFPAFALMAIVAASSVRWRMAYVLLALASFANLYAILLLPFYQNPGVKDWLGIADAIRTPLGIAIVAFVHVAVFAWCFTELRPRAVRRLDADALLDAAWEREPRLAETVPTDVRPAAGGAAPRVDADAFDERGGSGSATGFSFLRSARAILPDRSRQLHGEGGGRFDRLDLWIFVVIMVVALGLRTFRLAEPFRMHFDEVYHARTATEFLQDWRYGQRHDIYEFTHPHLAKYAMAVGLIVAGDDRVTAQREIGGAVRDVLVEPQWEDATLPDARAGDRFYVAGGDQLRAYDLVSRRLIGTWSVPGAAVLALDSVGHRILVGSDDGTIAVLDTAAELDPLRRTSSGTMGSSTGATAPPPTPPALARIGGPVTQLAVADDGSWLAAATAAGDVVSLDPVSGAESGRTKLQGVTDLADGGSGDGLTADPTAVPDHAAAAAALAAITGGDASVYARRLGTSGAAGAPPTSVVVLGGFPVAQRAAIDAAIADGRLAGFTVAPVGRIAVATAAGIAFVAPTTGEVVDNVATEAAVLGLAKVVGIDKPSLYTALADRHVAVVLLGDVAGKTPPALGSTFRMPGDVRRVLFDAPTGMVHVLGRTADGTADTIYVVEPHGNAVYADARLPFAATAWALDADGAHPSGDRQVILAASATGSLGSVDTGSHAFAWRLPGVIAGALTAGLLFLLVRILFRRRDIAVLAAILTLADGMLFVQSRIGMNDVYVGLFIVAAYALFAALWTGRWRQPWAFWVVLPVVGVLLGLALASKWVALYALAGVVLLILGRSALGRILLILGLVLGTTVLGYMAMAIPKEAVTSGGNLFFVALMIAATLAAVLVTVLHPIEWSAEETRLAIGGPAALGMVVFLAAVPLGIASKAFTLGSVAVTPLEVAFALVLGSGAVYLLLRFAAGWGMGPLAPPPDADDPIRLTAPAASAPSGWLRPGSMFGLPIVWAVVCLGAIPLAVYVVSYLPWVALGNRLTDTWPPGNAGQTLVELTKSMYDYHNGLRATHAASSPYWAWPFDLKPVWFYQDSFAAGTSAAIYDAGNLVAWWLSIPALVFVGWQAFLRRSLGLGLVTVAVALQWMPWARIDRATFQYHYYTAVPFLLIALAYLLAELRHGASARTWAMARLAAALAVLAPALLWLFKGPLCTFVRVEAVMPGSQACVATTPGNIILTARIAGLAGVLLVFGAILLAQLVALGRPGDEAGGSRGRFVRIGLTAFVAVAGLMLASAILPDTPILSQRGFAIEPIALVILIVLSPVAWVIATARDARRFVAGAVLACIVWFVVWYPNLAALPLPAAIVNAYQGLLPTYLYPFQFPVNTDPVVQGLKLIDGPSVLLLVFLTVTAVIVGYSAWTWRIAIAERDAERRDAQANADGADDEDDASMSLAGEDRA